MSTNDNDPTPFLAQEKVDTSEVRISPERAQEVGQKKAQEAMRSVIRLLRMMGWGAVVLLLPLGLFGIGWLVDACLHRPLQQPSLGLSALAIVGLLLCLMPLFFLVAASRLVRRDRRGVGMATLGTCLPWLGFLLTSPSALLAALSGDFRLVPIPVLMFLLIIAGMMSRDRLTRYHRTYIGETTSTPTRLDRLGGWAVWISLGAVLIVVAAAGAVPHFGVRSIHVTYFRVGATLALLVSAAGVALATTSLILSLRGRAKSWFGVPVFALLLNPLILSAVGGAGLHGSPTALIAAAFGWDTDRDTAIFRPCPEIFGDGPPPEELAVDIGHGVEMEFRLIPAGTFRMGCPEPEDSVRKTFPGQHIGCTSFERPVQQVEITQPFYIGKFEVTQRQWVAVMENLPQFRKRDVGPENPIIGVSWADCHRFVGKLNENVSRGHRFFALPTEAQWEYACRAGSATRYHWGNDVGPVFAHAWMKKNSFERLHQVGVKRPNVWDLHDMQGNAAEFCEDFFDRYRGGACRDPSGPFSGKEVVVRGGSFRSDTFDLRTSRRRPASREQPTDSVGFRIILRLPYLP